MPGSGACLYVASVQQKGGTKVLLSCIELIKCQ